MSKYKKTPLQEERGRSQTTYSHREDTSYSKDISYSRREDTSLNKNRSQSPYFRQEDTSSNRYRNQSPYSHWENTSLNRNRSLSPYSCQEDTSLNKNRSQSPYFRQEDTSSNRYRSRASYSHREDTSLNRNGRQIPYSHRGDSLLNVRDNEREIRERNISEDNHRRNESRERNREEIAELCRAVLGLAREVRELRQEKEENQPRTRHSLSPNPSSTRYTNVRKVLEPMNHEYKKAFRNEVVQTLKGLDDSLTIDHKSRWTDIEKHVTQDIIPVIKRALGDRFQYTDIELKKILQNLHRHRRDVYIVSQNPSKSKANKQRTGINTRRKDKKERRQRGFRYMIDIKDQKLTELQPSIPWNDWIESLEAIINDSGYHSDEISETDTEKVQEEKNRNIRPSRNENSNHVLHVYDKQWRSSKIRNLLRHADLTGESIQNIKIGRKRWYNDRLYIENNSKPPHNAPAWAISSSYHSE